MSKIANFENLIFNEHLGDNRGDLPSFGTNFVGDTSRLASFNIEHSPVDMGYILMSLWGVEKNSHKVELNGINLFASGNFAYQIGRHTTSNWVIPFNSNILRQGNNSLQLLRDTNGGDNFHLYTAIVNWKEEISFSGRSRLNLIERVSGS
jgi:hypothetical protein